MTNLTCILLAMLELTMLHCDGGESQSAIGEITKHPIFSHAPGSPFAVGTGPGDVVVGDLNKDGNLDVITPNGKSKDVTVLLGDGKGAFKAAQKSPIPTGAPMHLPVLGDLNGDGNLDLVLTNHDSHDVTVLLGNGAAEFTPAPRSPFAARSGSKAHNHGLALGDVNRDGNLDIVTGDQDANSVSVLLGDGKADFTAAPGSPFAVGRAPYPLALGDINRDGKLDLVTPNTGSSDVTILLGDGKGGFTASPGSPLPLAHRPYYAALADVNQDGNLDLVTTHDDSNLLSVSLGDGTGRFKSAPGSPIDLGQCAWGVVIGDVNGDKTMDLVAATNTTITVLLGAGGSRFSPATGSPFAAGRGAWKVALGDVNRDGKQDIIANNLENNAVMVLLGR